MKHIVMNNSIWTTTSPSLSDFEFSHFCRYFSILFDSYRHSLLNKIKFYDENMSIVFFILISRDVYQKLMNTN